MADSDAAPGAPAVTRDEAVRIERDTMGEVAVPARALWRAQTQRAIENFPISGQPVDPAIVHALALVKEYAAVVNGRLGVLDHDVAAAIASAAASVARGEHDEHFPVDVFQTGSGTSTNMNVNEVVATLATRDLGRPVHANDEVNAGQSSNDTFPTALHLAAAMVVRDVTLPGLRSLAASLHDTSRRLARVVTAGRTHLMDATPVTLGQRFSGYAAQVDASVARVEATLDRLLEVPLGGTAVGTGVNVPEGFADGVVTALAKHTGMDVREAGNHMEAHAARDGLVETSAALRSAAVSLTKICNDLRWMGSGPRAGLAEIALPDLQPGSSIMPGKVNPVLPEATLMVCARVIGNDATIAWAGASGSFELNVAMPVMGQALVESARLLGRSADLMARRCVDGITAHAEHTRSLAEGSPAIVTPLNRVIGYEAAAEVAKAALAEGRSIRDVVIDAGYVERGDLSVDELDAMLDVLAMTRGPAAPVLDDSS